VISRAKKATKTAGKVVSKAIKTVKAASKA
jgi:hypothetical protein